MQTPVIKTPYTFLHSNLLLIGLPLLIILAFCSAYIGVKSHIAASEQAAASRQLKHNGMPQSHDLPAVNVSPASSLPTVDAPFGNAAPKTGVTDIQPAFTPQRASGNTPTSNMNVSTTPNNATLTDTSSAESNIDSNSSSAPTNTYHRKRSH